MEIYKNKPNPCSITFARVPMTSPALVSVWAEVSLEISVTGEISIETTLVTTESFKWTKETGSSSSKTKKVNHFTYNAAVSIGIELQVGIVVNIGFAKVDVDVAKVTLSIGAEGKVQAKSSADYPDCADVTVDGIFKVTVKIGLLGGSGKKQKVAFSATLFSLKWTIISLHIESNPFQIVDKCTRKCTVTISAGTAYSTKSLTVAKGSTIENLSAPTRSGYTFTGWYQDSACTTKWDFSTDKVTGNMTLYAGWKLIVKETTAPTKTDTPTQIDSPTQTDAPTQKPTTAPSTEEANLKYLVYEVNDSAVTITGYTGEPVSLTIPATIEEYPVTIIKDDAFKLCQSLKSITLPDTLTTIGRGAFHTCKALESIDLPNGLIEIGSTAFCDCDCLTSVHIPDSVTTIGSDAFSGCDNLSSVTLPSGWASVGSYEFTPFYECPKLTSIVIPEGATQIPDSAFDGMTSLKSITLPDTLKTIGYCAFQCCYALESIELPDRLTKIAPNAFRNCYSLTNVLIPDGVEYIGSHAFDGCANLSNVALPASWKSVITLKDSYESPFVNCPKLTSLAIPEKAKSVPAYAFLDMTSLKSILLPNTLTCIQVSAFDNCTSLESIDLPNGLTEIHAYAFYKCDSLTSVRIPDSVKMIDFAAFSSCNNLSNVTLPLGWTSVGTICGSPFTYCPKLTAFVIPEGVTHILPCAFENMTNLVSITLPDSLKTISWQAFKDCTSLTTLYFPSNVSSIGSDAFSGCTSLKHVYTHSADSYVATFFAEYYPEVEVHVHTDGLCQVSFHTNGGTAVSPVYATAGALLAAPNTPTRTDYTFTGWYRDADCTQRWNFAADHVPGISLTLYAGWTYSPANFVFTVTGNAATLTAYTGTDAYITLPAAFGDVPVTALAENAIPSQVRSVHIPDSITTVDPLAFRWAENLGKITVDEQNPTYCAADGVLYTRDGTLTVYPRGKSGDPFTVRDGTTAIGAYAFYRCTALRGIALPASVTHLADMAIYGCENLCDIAFAADPEQIGASCFLGCHSDLCITGPLNAARLTQWADSCYLNYNKYTVTFMQEDEVLAATYVRAGGLVGEPPAPEDSTITLQGWSTTADGQSLWHFDTDIMPQADLTLYAVWRYDFTTQSVTDGVQLTRYTGDKNDVRVPEQIDGVTVVPIAEDAFPDASVTLNGNKGSVTEAFAKAHNMNFTALKYTVSFLSNGGTYAEPQTHAATESIAEPSVLRTGYALTGWYTDSALTQRWDFAADTMPASDLRLYAGWSKTDETVADIPFTFDSTADGLVITGYTGSLGTAEIPAEINGLPVIAIADFAFYRNSTLLQLTVPGSVKTIGESAFAQSYIGSVTLQNGVSSIGAHAFADCTELSDITLPGSVSAIGRAAFQNCSALTAIALPEALKTIGENTFSGCIFLDTVSLPAGLETIASAAFAGCTHLTDITIGANVSDIAVDAFNGCTGLTNLHVSANSMYYTSADGVLLSGDGSQLLLYPQGRTAETYTIPDTVIAIGEQAMSGSWITTLVLNKRLTSIGDGALRGSPRLQTITFAPDGQLSVIGTSAFSGCISLTDVDFPASLKSIGASAFASCGLTRVSIPEKVEIGTDAFRDSDTLTIYGVQNSTAAAFAQTNGIRFIDPAIHVAVTGITLPETLQMKLGDTTRLTPTLAPDNTTETAVTWHTSDASVVFVDEKGELSARYVGTATITATAANASTAACTVTVERIGSLPEQVVLSDTALSLPVGMLYPLTAAVLPEGCLDANITWTTSDGAVALHQNGCVLALSEGTATLTASTANGRTASCTVTVHPAFGEADMTLPASLTEIDEEAFYGLPLTSVACPYGLKTIGAGAFANCTALRKIMIPASVSQIDDTAFDGCTALLIYGARDSQAEAFALRHGFTFVLQ